MLHYIFQTLLWNTSNAEAEFVSWLLYITSVQSTWAIKSLFFIFFFWGGRGLLSFSVIFNHFVTVHWVKIIVRILKPSLWYTNYWKVMFQIIQVKKKFISILNSTSDVKMAKWHGIIISYLYSCKVHYSSWLLLFSNGVWKFTLSFKRSTNFYSICWKHRSYQSWAILADDTNHLWSNRQQHFLHNGT